VIPSRAFLPVIALGALAGCATTPPDRYAQIDVCLAGDRAWDYQNERCIPAPAPQVDALRMDKSARTLFAYRDGQLVRAFRVAMGRGGLGPKQRQGDGRVPEGRYLITAHNPASAFHLSLRIGYPTPEQIAAAAASGASPGGDIMIHGLPNGQGGIGSRHTRDDWTDGCVALTDPEIEWLYRAVAVGTPIEIEA
jgi:murein L,D-transpeptidase YafK